MDQYKMLSLESLKPSKTNPRKHFDKKQFSDLKESIREKGIIQPLLVRLVKEDLEIVTGERRYRAAMELKLKEVPCIVRELDDEQAREIQIIENLQREDVHPLDEAEGFAELLEAGKHTPESIAEKVGKSVSWVYQSLKLNELIPELKKKFWDGVINRTHALLLSRLPAEMQKEVMKQTISGYREVSMNRLRETIDHHYLSLHDGPFKKDDATLVPAAGACTTCPKRTGYNPELFPDLSKKDMCLDSSCFHKKLKAFAQQKFEEFEERGIKAIAVEGAYSPNIETGVTKKVIEKHDYEEVKGNAEKKKSGQVQAVIVSDDDPQRIGKTISIILNKKESSDNGSTRVKRPGKAELFKRKIERESVNRIIQQILIKVNVPQLPQKVYAHLVEDIASGYMSNGTVEFYKKYLGYSDLKPCSGNNALDKRIHNPKTPIGELHKIALTGLIFKRFQSDAADDYADLLKIDATGIRRKVKEEFEAARKAKEAGKVNIQAAQKGGVCSVCGCTETKPCIDKKGNTCSWVNNSRTLCNNPKCLKAASAQENKQSKKQVSKIISKLTKPIKKKTAKSMKPVKKSKGKKK